MVSFYNQNKEEKNTYFFPVHKDMNLVTFTLEANGITQVCFEWTPGPNDPSRIGCHMNVEYKKRFQQLLCSMINEVATDKLENPEHFCQELNSMPSSQNPVPKMRVSEEDLNNVLMEQAKKEETKLANTGRLYYIRQ
jgi:hypothetical protein